MKNKIKILSICILFSLFFMLSTVSATTETAPYIQWQKSLGHPYYDYPYAYGIQQTPEHDYIVGEVDKYDGDIKTSNVFKLSSDGIISGQTQLPFEPGITQVVGISMCRLSDGNYADLCDILLGGSVYWRVYKVDKNGKTLSVGDISGGNGYEPAYSVQPTSDCGCIAAGRTNTDIAHATIVKFDNNMKETWRKTLQDNCEALYAQQTSDGGYIVCDNFPTFDHGAEINIYKLDTTGNIVWQKRYGGSSDDYAVSIHQTSDGGYIFVGNTCSPEIPGYHKDYDIWVMKLDMSGNIAWQKALGGSGIDFARSVQQTSDHNYIVFASTESHDGDITDIKGWRDAWLVKLDTNGNIIWQKCFGGLGSGLGFEDIYSGSGQQTYDDGYIFAGTSDGLGWIAKVAPDVNSPALVANFSATPTSGIVPLNVSFTDMSTGSPTSWNWDFGGGTNSTDQNATHVYSTAGTYIVNLTVTNAIGTNSNTATINVLKATPTITWNNPTDMSYGTALGDAQLNAVASVTGTFTYKVDGTPIVTGNILSLGVHTLHVDFTAIDSPNYNKVSKDVQITVKDTTPPTITASSKPMTLWPPNHKYQTVSIKDFVSSVKDVGDPSVDFSKVVITSISSDEPEFAPGKDDENTLKDIVIKDSQTVDLRAERQGDGNGRVYTINYKVSDASGNMAYGSSQVWVPHDQGKGPTAIDDGSAKGYTVYPPNEQ